MDDADKVKEALAAVLSTAAPKKTATLADVCLRYFDEIDQVRRHTGRWEAVHDFLVAADLIRPSAKTGAVRSAYWRASKDLKLTAARDDIAVRESIQAAAPLEVEHIRPPVPSAPAAPVARAPAAVRPSVTDPAASVVRAAEPDRSPAAGDEKLSDLQSRFGMAALKRQQAAQLAEHAEFQKTVAAAGGVYGHARAVRAAEQAAADEATPDVPARGRMSR